MRKIIFWLGAVSMLSACGGGGYGDGGGGGSYNGGGSAYASCTFITGGSSKLAENCTGCTNLGAEADGDLYTAATVTSGVGSPQVGASGTFRATAQSGIVFPAGSKAGVFFSTSGSGSNTTTLNTYLSGALQESDGGVNHQMALTQGGTNAAAYSYFNTTKQFDAVEVVVTTGGGTSEQIYEICADGHV